MTKPKGIFKKRKFRGNKYCRTYPIDKAPQNEQTPEPSTSGVVPKPGTSSAPSAVADQFPVIPQIPVQADTACTKPHLPVQTGSRSTPTPTTLSAPIPPLEDDSAISVKWNTYATNMSSIMPNLLEDEKFVDVTLACDGKYIKCHKVILAACSPYFKELLSVNPCQHPIILMKDFQFLEIRAIVDFMYCGVANIPQHNLPRLLEVAYVLQIKGLTGMSDAGSQVDEAISTRYVSRPAGSRKLRKRSETDTQQFGSKTARQPVKKLKLTPLLMGSSKSPIDRQSSDESSNQSEAPQLPGPALAISPEPTTLLDSVCIKVEAPSYGVAESSKCPYGNDQNLTKDDSSQLGQFQLLTLPNPRTIKQEVGEETFDQTDQDPLDLESGVS